jgi:hypothetical protein
MFSVQGNLPPPDPIGRERTIGELLDILIDATPQPSGPPHST